MGAFELSILISFPLVGLSRVPAGLEPWSPAALTRNGLQVSNSNQVVSRCREGEHPSDALQASMSSLAHQPDGLDPTKDLFHPLAFSLSDRVARMSGRAAVDRSGSVLLVLHHMGRHLQLLQLGHKVLRVVGLVRPQGHRRVSRPGICSAISTAASRSAVPVA